MSGLFFYRLAILHFTRPAISDNWTWFDFCWKMGHQSRRQPRYPCCNWPNIAFYVTRLKPVFARPYYGLKLVIEIYLVHLNMANLPWSSLYGTFWGMAEHSSFRWGSYSWPEGQEVILYICLNLLILCSRTSGFHDASDLEQNSPNRWLFFYMFRFCLKHPLIGALCLCCYGNHWISIGFEISGATNWKVIR